ncbi:MAG: Tetratricopeptide repeat protein [Syntrophus sp. PtaB.Bin001]|nr:MAG: Tetratricopeptide repeat protein [Syntrophus sp. PtaB.Bin001]
MTKKILEAELSKPDFLNALLSKFTDFYNLNKRVVILATSGLVIVLLIITSWFSYNYYYEKNAWIQYKKIATSNDKLSVSAKDEEMIKSYQNLNLKYPQSQAALLSFYRLGNLYFQKNDIDAAIKSYNTYISKASDNNEFKALSFSGLAYCYELKKDYKHALLSLQEAEKIEAGKNFRQFIYRDMARMYESMANSNEALKFYKKSLEHSTDPVFTLLIKRKISILS